MTIRQIQLLLDYLGYDPGTIDGADGAKTRAAVKAFQRDFGGLTVDGIAGTATEKALRHAVAYGMPEKKQGAAAEDPSAAADKAGTFWDDIKHFKRSEFKCKCGGKYCSGYPVEMQEKVVKAADKVREHFGKPMTVSSGIRCTRHNAAVNGVSNSRHLQGKAIDFCVSGFSAPMVLAYVQSLPEIRYAYAIDSNFVHMDIL